MKIIDLNKNPEEYCPSLDRCQVNDCPLAIKPNKYITLPEDKLLYNWHKCRCKKRIRMHIAKEFGLKNMGLTPREASAMRQSIRLKQLNFPTQGKNPETAVASKETSTITISQEITIPKVKPIKEEILNKFTIKEISK